MHKTAATCCDDGVAGFQPNATGFSAENAITPPRRAPFAVVLAASILFAACSATFIAPYDETTDRLVTELTVKTETAIARADSHQLAADERERFFTEAIGTVRTMKTRSSLFAKNQDEIDALGQLEQRYNDLHAHSASLRGSLSTGLRATLLALEQIQVAKKRSSVFSAGLKKTNSGH